MERFRARASRRPPRSLPTVVRTGRTSTGEPGAGPGSGFSPRRMSTISERQSRLRRARGSDGFFRSDAVHPTIGVYASRGKAGRSAAQRFSMRQGRSDSRSTSRRRECTPRGLEHVRPGDRGSQDCQRNPRCLVDPANRNRHAGWNAIGPPADSEGGAPCRELPVRVDFPDDERLLPRIGLATDIEAMREAGGLPARARTRGPVELLRRARESARGAPAAKRRAGAELHRLGSKPAGIVPRRPSAADGDLGRGRAGVDQSSTEDCAGAYGRGGSSGSWSATLPGSSMFRGGRLLSSTCGGSGIERWRGGNES